MTTIKHKMLSRLEDLSSGAHAAIYGAGRQGHNLARTLQTVRPDIKVEAFLDDSLYLPDASPPILHPDQTKSLPMETEMVIVPSRIYEQVQDRLNEFPLRVLVLSPELDFTHRFLPTERAGLSSDEKAVCSILPTPDASVFRKLLDSRTVGHGTTIPERYPVGGKLYLDYIDLASVRTAISGGVANGCIEMNMLRNLPVLKLMIGFDPFAALYEKSAVKEKLESSGRFRFESCGLGSKQEIMYLHKDGQGSYVRHHPQAPADTAVSIITLDKYIKDSDVSRVDLIKLDVEGSEIEALKGAVETIRSHRPFLAVCIYHDRMDMIAIPLFLAEHLKNYSFRLGHYSDGFTDTVFYALPDERARDNE